MATLARTPHQVMLASEDFRTLRSCSDVDSERRQNNNRKSALVPRTNAMMHPVIEINRLSNKIVDGDYESAILSLTKTLKNIKLVLSGDAKIATPDESKSSQQDDELRSLHSMEGCDSQDDDTTIPSRSNSFKYDFYHSSSSSSSFLKTTIAGRTISIFKNPLIVEGDYVGIPFDQKLCEELSCVAIYNLALSHQLKAMSLLTSVDKRETSNARACLRKAMSLYEYSHQIFNSLSIHVQVPELRFMAIACNLAQIHQLFNDLEKAKRCNEYLLSVLMYTIDGGKSNFSPRVQVEFEQFLKTVQHLVIPEDYTAAAA